MSKSGTQTIGCEVTSCRYNHRGSDCNLSSIQVQHDTSGSDPNESLCGSYSQKSGDDWQ